MRVWTAVEAQLYFNAMALITKEAGRKNINIVRNVVHSKLTVMAVQIVQKALDTLTLSCLLGSQWVVIQLYL